MGENKLFEHHKIYKDKKVSGYTTYSHVFEGEIYGYLLQLTDTVNDGIDIEDGYIEEYGVQINNYSISLGDILVCGNDRYKVTSSTVIKGKCFARIVREWHIV